ncbi:C40 family peptidase [Denitrobaculum tricleocarpae]|uniref:NlpC/P60 family protein n=1 Tax=Denitrobaculum tricleocarpae TaxID=2591009 RepID=A0A545T3Z1_9PROT|nr:NlpC/P60 family protein [Denitrobaculum tricleocarpae]TQV71939.1 NlpC/P60 family protein [Denitrobaculum tricleocarpae]
MSVAVDSKLDPRVNCYRDDLAASYLEGKVDSRRFVMGRQAQVVQCGAPLLRNPSADSPQDSQLLVGETVQVYDEAGGYSWLQSEFDGYVGYVRTSALRDEVTEATDCVSVLRSFLYPEPDIKTPPIATLNMAAQVTVNDQYQRFSLLSTGGWIYSDHLMTIDAHEPDFVATALRFLEMPYLWGGKGNMGIDCSGLVQVSLARSGRACPRDTYMQAKTLGIEIPGEDGNYPMRRGDLIYWPGHVAIVLDQETVVHASGHHMLVTIEPWRDVDERVRIETGGKGIEVLRRVPQSNG